MKHLKSSISIDLGSLFIEDMYTNLSKEMDDRGLSGVSKGLNGDDFLFDIRGQMETHLSKLNINFGGFERNA